MGAGAAACAAVSLAALSKNSPMLRLPSRKEEEEEEEEDQEGEKGARASAVDMTIRSFLVDTGPRAPRVVYPTGH